MDVTLLILIPFFVLGVFGLAVAFGWQPPQRLPDDTQLAQVLADRVPDFRPGTRALDTRRRAALIASSDSDETLIVRAFGDGVTLVRALPGGPVRVDCPRDRELVLHLGDLTQPTLHVELETAEAARLFAARLAKHSGSLERSPGSD